MMNWSIGTLKGMARTALRGSYWKSILAGFLLMICTASASSGVASRREDISEGLEETFGTNIADNPYFGMMLAILAGVALLAGIGGMALKILVLNPLEIGVRRYFMEDLYAPCELDRITLGFKMNYINGVFIMFLRSLFTVLWTFLLIVPGLIKSYEYRMIPYLLAENPDLTREEAFALSRQMMDGEKWNAFLLDLSFIGWIILSAFTLGLLNIFFVNPYKGLTDAALYMALREKIQYDPQAA